MKVKIEICPTEAQIASIPEFPDKLGEGHRANEKIVG